jgi:two-component system LytT family sensor kinase
MTSELTEARPPGRWSPVRVTLVAAAALLALGLLRFGELYFDDLTRGRQGTFPTRMLEEVTGTLTGLLVIPAIIWLCLRSPLRKASWQWQVPLYLAAAVGVSLIHTTLNWRLRLFAFSLAGLGHYDYGIMPLRYLMELQHGIVIFVFIVGLIHCVMWYRESQARTLRTSQLEARLAQAQLAGLRSQLQPHFLFNTLNTIAAAVWEDPARADALLTRLSELLRMALHVAPSHESSLAEELRVAGLYTDLMRARFEDRLTIRLDVEPATGNALVPQLVLQPLIENAIRHGGDRATGRIALEVRCSRNNGNVELAVRDHGSGFPEPPAGALGRGVGLGNTAERLKHLYGDQAALRLENAGDGGALVTVTIPWREAAAP